MVPGHASLQPDEVHSFSYSTPEMEAAAYEMRRTYLALNMVTPSDAVTPSAVAKVLEKLLRLPWMDIHVSASYPHDFLVRFSQPV